MGKKEAARYTVIPVRLGREVVGYLDKRRKDEPYRPGRSTFIREIIESWIEKDRTKARAK